MSQYLGQHFLKNKDAIAKIVASLDLKKGETVIEIGPGKGALTIPLAQKCAEVGAKLVGIEKDVEMVKGLRLKVKGGENTIQIITGDALMELPKLLAPNLSPLNLNLKPCKLVGNIPYYITGNLLRVIGELSVKPELIVLMIQKEVAERVVARPGQMNLLAAATQVWADVEILFSLPASDFEPAPEVESAVVRLKVKGERLKVPGIEKYYEFIHRAFKQPRKTLLNNLHENIKTLKRENPATNLKNNDGGIPLGRDIKTKDHENIKTREHKNIKTKEEILTELQKFGFNEKTRAQELSIDQLINLSPTCSQG